MFTNIITGLTVYHKKENFFPSKTKYLIKEKSVTRILLYFINTLYYNFTREVTVLKMTQDFFSLSFVCIIVTFNFWMGTSFSLHFRLK